MNLRPRHREDPEINLISLIDVLLVLLVFFMVSTTFQQEGRMIVRLPQANEAPATASQVAMKVVAATGSAPGESSTSRMAERPEARTRAPSLSCVR